MFMCHKAWTPFLHHDCLVQGAVSSLDQASSCPFGCVPSPKPFLPLALGSSGLCCCNPSPDTQSSTLGLAAGQCLWAEQSSASLPRSSKHWKGMAVHPSLGWGWVSAVWSLCLLVGVSQQGAAGNSCRFTPKPTPPGKSPPLLCSPSNSWRQEREWNWSGTERGNVHCGIAARTVVPGLG